MQEEEEVLTAAECECDDAAYLGLSTDNFFFIFFQSREAHFFEALSAAALKAYPHLGLFPPDREFPLRFQPKAEAETLIQLGRTQSSRLQHRVKVWLKLNVQCQARGRCPSS